MTALSTSAGATKRAREKTFRHALARMYDGGNASCAQPKTTGRVLATIDSMMRPQAWSGSSSCLLNALRRLEVRVSATASDRAGPTSLVRSGYPSDVRMRPRSRSNSESSAPARLSAASTESATARVMMRGSAVDHQRRERTNLPENRSPWRWPQVPARARAAEVSELLGAAK